MPTVAQLMADPEFHQFTVDERKMLLGEADPEYLSLSPEEQDKLLGSVMPGDVVDAPAIPDKFPPPPANAPSIGPGKPLSPEPSTSAEGLDRLLEAIGLGGTGRNPTSRTLVEEPLNESDFAATGRGLLNTAATAAAPAAMGAVATASPWMLARAGAGGLGGATGGEMAGRSLGEKFDIPEIGAALGELSGGLGGAKAGIAAGPVLSSVAGKTAGLGRSAVGLANSPVGQASLDTATLMGVPGAGKLGAAARLTGGISKKLNTAADEAKAILEAERLAKAHSVNSGLQPGPAFPPPPGMAASAPPPAVSRPAAPTSLTPQVPPSGRTVTGRAAKAAGTGMEFRPSPTTGSATLKAPTPAPKAPEKPARVPFDRVKLDEAVDKLKSLDKGERAAVIRELRAGGASKEEIGEALATSHRTRTTPDLDIDADDLDEAQTIVDKLGGKRFALSYIERLKDDLGPDEYNAMKNAIQRARNPRAK